MGIRQISDQIYKSDGWFIGFEYFFYWRFVRVVPRIGERTWDCLMWLKKPQWGNMVPLENAVIVIRNSETLLYILARRLVLFSLGSCPLHWPKLPWVNNSNLIMVILFGAVSFLNFNFLGFGWSFKTFRIFLFAKMVRYFFLFYAVLSLQCICVVNLCYRRWWMRSFLGCIVQGCLIYVTEMYVTGWHGESVSLGAGSGCSRVRWHYPLSGNESQGASKVCMSLVHGPTQEKSASHIHSQPTMDPKRWHRGTEDPWWETVLPIVNLCLLQ